ncbi:MAG: homocysteine S-methyltransferase family protein [Clostridia bacterium]|nr:homocysteine S-methyltransferase family protein [Clostridia bacterium]
MGTQLQLRGMRGGDNPNEWNFSHGEDVTAVHRAYAEVGCNIFKINTFGANRYKLAGTGLSVSDCIKKAAENARKATADGIIALDVGPLGKLLQPVGDLPFDEAYEAFSEMIIAAKDVCDVIMLETFTDIYEIKAAMLAAKENCSLPLFVSAAFDGEGRLLSGTDADTYAAVVEGLGADAIGFNCGVGPKQLIPLVKRLREVCSLPIIVNPNAGLPKTDGKHTYFDLSPEEFAEDVQKLISLGAVAVGGCCGTTPEHIAAVINRCRNTDILPSASNGLTAVSSGSKTVYIGEKPVIIGERINPTGKPRFKKALHEKDMGYILGVASSQVDAGADILDVNVGLPETDEVTLLNETVNAVQGITNLPLQIDTTNAEALENAMRHYNGKPLVNSVNGKKESLNTVLPLVKKYGGVVVGLTLDENGIPDTAEGRFNIAKRIIGEAEKYGIAKKNIVIDPLTITVSTDKNAADITLTALKKIRAELGVCTVLGVSNVSFGLPERDRINSAFFTLALENGLDAGIINPSSDMMMSAYRSFCALKGCDENCADYIAAYSTGTEKKAPEAKQTLSLKAAIIKGLADAAALAAEELIKTKPALEMIDADIVPALDEVGDGFGKNKIFLPQLLMSAQAASKAFDVIKKTMSKSGSESKGNVVIATVKGDVHDIGKNITRVLLENYGFEVTDLGKDVPPDTVLEAVKKTGAAVCGLSALMTTTVPAMKQTTEMLKKEIPGCKVVVGGAVLTQEYADMIGADFYAKDAMNTVRYCQEIYK